MSSIASTFNQMLERVFTGRNDISLRAAWANVFQVPPEDTSSIFYLLSKVNLSLSEIRSTLQSMPSFDSALVVAPLEELSAAICFPNLDTTVGSISYYYNDRVKMSLQIAVSYFDKQQISQHIPEDELDNIKKEIDNLFNYVIESEIETDFKHVILDLIETIRRAIAEFQIRGNQSIQDVLDQSLGRLIRASRQSNIDHEEKLALSKALTVLSLIDKSLSIAQRVEPYLPIVAAALPALSGK